MIEEWPWEFLRLVIGFTIALFLAIFAFTAMSQMGNQLLSYEICMDLDPYTFCLDQQAGCYRGCMTATNGSLGIYESCAEQCELYYNCEAKK